MKLKNSSRMTTVFTGGQSSFTAKHRNIPTSRRRFKDSATATYIGLIAYAIQDSPLKMLTFKQIMMKLEPCLFGDKKGIGNNIRVCLSSNKCFVKVPVDPSYPNPKLNFWKVDENGISPKMFRRHFKGIMHMFPQSARKCWQTEAEETTSSPERLTPANKVLEHKSEVKFSSSFSIESLLKSDRGGKRMRGVQIQEHPDEAHFGETSEPMASYIDQFTSQERLRISPTLHYGLYFPHLIKNDPIVLLSPTFMLDSVI
ncbi:hypothetical protein DNTS_025419 [Danionella cerebrum]|uniref:Fork-head domain-containing protein n=1 Tax=Danionella cerebrum TaxID=2873325 RepID=A0A553Q328_9TELE|nr:hypothetical protein DNTS_025419 [Danionella translucida]